MRIFSPFIVVGVAAFVVSLAGCGKEASVDAALDNAVKEMQTPPPDAQVATPAVQAPPPPASSAASAKPAPAATTQVAQQMNQAVASYKGGNYEDAVRRLQWLRAQKGNTPQQIMALQEATAAVMADIYALAARGDARAKLAVKEYERLQNASQ